MHENDTIGKIKIIEKVKPFPRKPCFKTFAT